MKDGRSDAGTIMHRKVSLYMSGSCTKNGKDFNSKLI